jgi:hypothetical protein
MTAAQRLKRLYITLRWYDSHIAHSCCKLDEIPEEDMKLALELENEMHELQRLENTAKKPRRKKNK